jgi:hypothetical protein
VEQTPDSGDCGMRISDCGLENKFLLFNPQSEIRIPQFPYKRVTTAR